MSTIKILLTGTPLLQGKVDFANKLGFFARSGDDKIGEVLISPQIKNNLNDDILELRIMHYRYLFGNKPIAQVSLKDKNVNMEAIWLHQSDIIMHVIDSRQDWDLNRVFLEMLCNDLTLLRLGKKKILLLDIVYKGGSSHVMESYHILNSRDWIHIANCVIEFDNDESKNHVANELNLLISKQIME